MLATFSPERFKKALLSYLITLGVIWGVLVVSGFGLPLVLETIPYSRLAVGKIVSGFLAIGFVALGSLSIGVVCNGIFSVGIFAVGGTACGVIAIGGVTAIGVIAVGMNAVGVVAIGGNAMGIYALAYRAKNRGRYILSPERQDAKAVALFTRWFRKLKDAFAPDKHNASITDI